MVERLIAYFSKFHPLTDDEKSVIQKGTVIREIKKGKVLLEEAKIFQVSAKFIDLS